jgi:hypothetical protein
MARMNRQAAVAVIVTGSNAGALVRLSPSNQRS